MSTVPEKMAYAVKLAFQRSRMFRKARAMYIKQYVGKYYREKYGLVGDEPVNMIFNVIRAMVPNYVMKNPRTKVSTEIVEYDNYAFLLSKALDQIDAKIKFKDILRLGVVDAHFCMGIFKTGIADSFSMLDFGDQFIDQGQLFTDWVDLDDFVFDPYASLLRRAGWMGDRVTVPRQMLLDDDNFDHDAIMKLPRSTTSQTERKAQALSKSDMSLSEIDDLNDFVDLMELWIAGENIKVYMPDPHQLILPEFLDGEDFYGPDDGPYDILSLTQPVPGNPFPIAPVGIYYDLHMMANNVVTKVLKQAARQKDIVVVDPAGQDEGEDIRTASDGETILGNPDTVKSISLGGQNQGNERMMNQLHNWFNYMAGNPDQIAGASSDAESATEFQGMQANASVTLEDARGMVADCASNIKRKHAWYFHHDPFLEAPIAIRKPGGKREQLALTPAQRRGDFEDYVFSIKYRSMLTLDPNIKSRRLMEFAIKVIPSLMTSAQIASQMGVEFNVSNCVKDLAESMDIDEEILDWFNDPLFVERIKLMYAMGPKPTGKASIQSNGQAANTASVPNMQQMNRQNQQQGAAESQSQLKEGM